MEVYPDILKNKHLPIENKFLFLDKSIIGRNRGKSPDSCTRSTAQNMTFWKRMDGVWLKNKITHAQL